MSKAGHRPQRTCIGCGERETQHDLIRLAMGDDGLLVVEAKKRRGRGGYLHRNPACWRAFLARKGHYRTFHGAISRETKEQLVKELMEREWE